MANMALKNFELSHNFDLTMFELTGSDLYTLPAQKGEMCMPNKFLVMYALVIELSNTISCFGVMTPIFFRKLPILFIKFG